MSYPYPQDRHRDRKEKGDQPYKDATEALTQKEAELEEQASVPYDEREGETIEEQEQAAQERFEDIADESSRDRDE